MGNGLGSLEAGRWENRERMGSEESKEGDGGEGKYVEEGRGNENRVRVQGQLGEHW